jgi:hypothetical protein
MTDITILEQFPVVLTKDNTWKPLQLGRSGAIIYLPEDAVLVMPMIITAPDEKSTT